eukprot:scaffold342913_cov31-Attheya_sp.AAC.1
MTKPTAHSPDLIPLDGPLLANRMFLVKRDLPGVRPSTGDPMQQVAAAMRVFTAEAAAQRQLQQQQRVDDRHQGIRARYNPEMKCPAQFSALQVK